MAHRVFVSILAHPHAVRCPIYDARCVTCFLIDGMRGPWFSLRPRADVSRDGTWGPCLAAACVA
eukprot:4912594-Pyramimonas_sp.AAC.1